MNGLKFRFFYLFIVTYFLSNLFFSHSFAQQFAPSRIDLWQCPGDPTYFFTEDMILQDLDGDGNLDLFRANADSLIIMMGQSGMAFSDPQVIHNSSVSGNARDLDSADLNGDGFADFLVALDGFPDFAIYYGNGAGGISQMDTLYLGIQPQFIELADMNSDSNPDMLLVRNDNELWCYLGQGGKQFTPAGHLTLKSGITFLSDIRIGDFNEDNSPDVAAGVLTLAGADSILLIFGDGNGGFSHFTGFDSGNPFPISIDVGDLNGDTHLDIAAACPGSTTYMGSRACLFFGDGAGQLGAALVNEWGNNETRIKIADVDGDTNPDLLISNPPFDDISYLSGDGSGTFVLKGNLNCPNYPQTLAVGDADNDGHTDVLVSTPASVSIFLTDDQGFIQQAPAVQASNKPVKVRTADFNQDNLPDIAVIVQDSNRCKIFLNQGNGNFEHHLSLETGIKPWDLWIDDFNNDNRPDIVVANRNDNSIDVFAGQAGGDFAQPQNYAVNTRPIRVESALLNNDSYPDLLVLNETDKNVSVLLNNGDGTFSSSGSVDVVAKPYDFATGDFNNDGNSDFVVSLNEFGFNLAIYLGDGTGNFPTFNYLTGLWTLAAEVPLAVGKMNSDANLDIVYTENRHLVTLLGTGDGANFTQVSSRLPAGSFGLYPFALADLNGDTFPDAAIPNLKVAGNNTLIAWNDGSGGFTLDRFAYECGQDGMHIAAAEFNNDNFTDLVVANAGSNSLTLLYNTGTIPVSHDVGVAAILSPPVSLNPGESVTPKAVVQNFGTASETFIAAFSIGGSYNENQTVTLAAAEKDTLTFPEWTATQPGGFQAIATVNLAGDENPANDRVVRNITVQDTGSGATLTLTGVTPNHSGLGGVVSVVISGDGFQDGAAVKLSKDGEPDILIPPPFVTLNSAQEIEALFNLRDAQLGDWDVTVVNPDNSYGTLYGGFTVEPLTEDLWINVVGRNPLQLGEITPVTIWYGNNGNADARDIWIGIAVSDEPYFKLDLEVAPKIFIKLLDYHLAVIQAVLKPGETDHFNINLRFPIEAGTGDFNFEARISVYDPQPQLFWNGHFYMENTGEPIPPPGWSFPKTTQISGCGAMSTWSGWLKNFVANDIANTSNIAGVTAEEAYNYGKGEITSNFQETFIDYIDDGQGGQIKEVYDKAGNLLCYEEVVENYLDISKLIWGRVNSVDPNDKVGPGGKGSENWVTSDIQFPYTIYFENADTATAPAHKVVVRDTLDPDLDWLTLQFLDYKHQPTAVTFDSTTGAIAWTFDGIDLPPNVNPPEGESHFNFYLEPKQNLASGTQITNRASIIFDYNPPIKTGTVLNTIDALAPTSSLNPLPDETDQLGIQLSWSGHDDANGSGIDRYVIYASENGAPYRRLGNYTGNSAVVVGKDGTHYDFYIEAVDVAGNRENKAQQPEASTLVKAKRKIAVSPSPFVPARGHTQMTFFGGDLPHATIKIFNRAGDPIVALKETEGNYRLTWDGTNEAGNPCASGVYIWVLDSPTGGKDRGKFAIIR